MSPEPVAGPSAGGSADASAAAERVREIEAMLVQARTGVLAAASGAPATNAPSTTASSPTAFASMLQAAGAEQTGAGQSGQSSQYDTLIQQAAARNGVDPSLLHGLIQQESNFDPSSTSSAGALGLTQLMPGTASSLGVANPLDPSESIEGGARYLRQMLETFGGNTEQALAAYNAGPAAVQRYGGVPPYSETQSYVSKVLGYAETYRRSISTAAVPMGYA